MNYSGRFKNNYENVVDEIDQALSQNDKELAIRLAHTVKGVSGELSANKIYSVADELEKALIKGSVNVNALLEELDKELIKIFKSEVFLEEEVKIETKFRENKELDIDQITSLLEIIGVLLLEGNPDSIDYIKRIEKRQKILFFLRK